MGYTFKFCCCFCFLFKMFLFPLSYREVLDFFTRGRDYKMRDRLKKVPHCWPLAYFLDQLVSASNLTFWPAIPNPSAILVRLQRSFFISLSLSFPISFFSPLSLSLSSSISLSPFLLLRLSYLPSLPLSLSSSLYLSH